MQVEENAMNREQRIQHAMDFLCDIIPWNTPNYEEELRKAAEVFVVCVRLASVNKILEAK